jgi:hypothetical protein
VFVDIINNKLTWLSQIIYQNVTARRSYARQPDISLAQRTGLISKVNLDEGSKKQQIFEKKYHEKKILVLDDELSIGLLELSFQNYW